MGRPNVGKSSLFNRLAGEERSVVFEEAGTTRDSVDALVEWPGAGRVRIVDTAGMRRAIRVQGVEYYSFVRAGAAIERADAVAVVFDASEGLTAEDEKIAFRVLEAGRALLLVANKWDLVEDKDRVFKRLTEEAKLLGRATVVRTSALRGAASAHPGVAPRPAPTVVRPRGDVARERAAPGGPGAKPSPRSTGTLRYAAQVATRPPAFVLFGGGRTPEPTYRRYLENRFRDAFGLGRRADPPPGSAVGAAPDAPRPHAGGGRERPTVTLLVTGRGAAWLARLTGGQKVAGSNPAGPTDERDDGHRAGILRHPHRSQRPVVREDR